MNRYTLPLEQYDGRTPSPVAVYRPGNGPLAAMLMALGAFLGVEHLMTEQEVGALRGRDAHARAREDLATSMREIENEAAGAPLNAEQLSEMEATVKQIGDLDTLIEQFDVRDALIKRIGDPAQAARGEGASTAFAAPNVVKRPDNVYDLSAYRSRASSVDELPKLHRDGAMRVIEKAQFATTPNADKAREQVIHLLDQHVDDVLVPGAGAFDIGRRIIATDDPVYREAWARYVSRGPNGLSSRHLAVMQTYSDADGGYAIPFTIDPTFINTSNGAVNPLRNGMARVETITTKSWHGVTTAGVTGGYAGETASPSAGNPTDVGDPIATPVRFHVWVPFTAEFQEDLGPGAVAAEIGALIQDYKDVTEADKFVNGTGSTQPEGIVWKLDNDGTKVITHSALNLNALDALVGGLGERFQPLAQFLAHRLSYQFTRTLGTAGAPANSIYDRVTDTLYGYPARISSAVDSTHLDGDEPLLLGDFRHFLIVDRVGMSTEYVPQTVDTNGVPNGGRGIYARARNTSKVLVVNAFRLLKIGNS